MSLKKNRVTQFTREALNPERRTTRSLLQRSTRGNVHTYVQATTSYVNLISEYLYLSGYEEKQARLFELKQILCDCWRYLPYTRRVSDFERFLQVRLERSQKEERPCFTGVHSPLSKLNHEGRFLLVARFFNNWSHKSIRLALRFKKGEVSESLMLLRCLLTSVETDKLGYVELAQIARVNSVLEGNFPEKTCRKIEKEIGGQYHALQFKTDWLTYRCELADLRTEILLDSEELNQLAEETTELIRSLPMEKPKLYDYILNQFSFNRLPAL
ncbi:hypothetical protein [Pelagicoccus albus]|uniref:Uncharacterized protein n=1 Tax=Pelagicoccus albus TaxID=415222 RepID=A0A7X1E7S9_9BACT|nr:hypothetical protein [Pelagicoccus albus]MBC2605511.1 hypothetical protein [Pelagicoccus albus]